MTSLQIRNNNRKQKNSQIHTHNHKCTKGTSEPLPYKPYLPYNYSKPEKAHRAGNIKSRNIKLKDLEIKKYPECKNPSPSNI